MLVNWLATAASERVDDERVLSAVHLTLHNATITRPVFFQAHVLQSFATALDCLKDIKVCVGCHMYMIVRGTRK